VRTPSLPHIDLHALDCELAELHARGTVGALLLYLPLLGLALIVASATSSTPFLRDALLAVGWLLVIIGLPAAPLGALLRLVFAARLRRKCRNLDPDILPDTLPLKPADRIANWRITRLTPDRIELACEPAPPILHTPMRFAVDAILVAICAVTLVGALQSPHPSALVASALVLVCAAVISASLDPDRLVITNPARAPSLTYTGHRVWSLFHLVRWSVPFEDLEDITLADDALIVRTPSTTHAIMGFARDPLARWRARRLIAMILDPNTAYQTRPSHAPEPTISARA